MKKEEKNKELVRRPISPHQMWTSSVDDMMREVEKLPVEPPWGPTAWSPEQKALEGSLKNVALAMNRLKEVIADHQERETAWIQASGAGPPIKATTKPFKRAGLHGQAAEVIKLVDEAEQALGLWASAEGSWWGKEGEVFRRRLSIVRKLAEIGAVQMVLASEEVKQ